MKIEIYSPESDVTCINGFTIVVDVFRAFSVSYFISKNDPEEYIAVDSIDLAFQLKNKYKDSILIGERNGIKIEGFDFGNSPTEIYGKSFKNKTVIHTTTAGTKGLLRQPVNNCVVAGSFVNAGALLNYIKNNKIDTVNIYCTAKKRGLYGEEDYLFAEYIKDRLEERGTDFEEIKMRLKKENAEKFSDKGFAPYTDFEYCMDLNRFNCILQRKYPGHTERYVILEKLV